MGSRGKNHTGHKFGKLTALRAAGKSGSFVTWECRCDCGSVLTVRSGNLTSGNTTSCGCALVREEMHFRHGYARSSGKSPEYLAYYNAKDRCRNANNIRYPRYGGRGIRFLFHSFEDFLHDIGPRPANHVLDRINNDGHYVRGNVRWVTKKESALNTSRNLRPK